MSIITQPRADSQVITSRGDARELLPEEMLSPLDLEIYGRAVEKAKLLPQETEQDCLNYEMVIEVDPISWTARGSN